MKLLNVDCIRSLRLRPEIVCSDGLIRRADIVQIGDVTFVHHLICEICTTVYRTASSTSGCHRLMETTFVEVSELNQFGSCRENDVQLILQAPPSHQLFVQVRKTSLKAFSMIVGCYCTYIRAMKSTQAFVCMSSLLEYEHTQF